jgi:hypothetical protein
MSIGTEIDSKIAAIKAAKNRIAKNESKKSDYFKSIYEPIEKILMAIDEDYIHYVFMGIDIYFMVDNYIVLSKTNKKIKSKAKITCLSKTNNQFHKGPREYWYSGDEVLFKEFISNYETFLLELSEHFKEVTETEADEKESRQEVGLLT